MTNGLFRAALGWGRVVAASHFYEWAAVAGQRARQPYAIARADGRPLAFVGIATPGEEGQPPSYAISDDAAERRHVGGPPPAAGPAVELHTDNGGEFLKHEDRRCRALGCSRREAARIRRGRAR